MASLPTLHIETLHFEQPSRPKAGMTVDDLDCLASKLAEAGIHSPSTVALLRGRLWHVDSDPAVLLCLGDPRHDVLGWWARLSVSSYSTLLLVSSEDLGRPDHLSPSDLPLLTGHGIILATRGHPADALVDLSVRQLREALDAERDALVDFAGYIPRFLAPRRPTLGSSVDRLVLDEAHKRGFRFALHPSMSVLDLDDDLAELAHDECLPLPYRTVRTDDDPTELVDWILDRRLARKTARLRNLVDTPRQMLTKFWE